MSHSILGYLFVCCESARRTLPSSISERKIGTAFVSDPMEVNIHPSLCRPFLLAIFFLFCCCIKFDCRILTASSSFPSLFGSFTMHKSSATSIERVEWKHVHKHCGSNHPATHGIHIEPMGSYRHR